MHPDPDPSPTTDAAEAAAIFLGPTLVGLGLWAATGSVGVALGGVGLMLLVLMGRELERVSDPTNQ